MGIKVNLILLVTFMAAVNDLRTYKIKNKMLSIFAIAGIIINFMEIGISGVIESIIGIFVPIILLFIVYICRGIGAGDIKLFATIGSIMGYEFALYNVAYSFVLGAIYSVIYILIKKSGIRRIKGLFQYIRLCVMTQSILPYIDISDQKSIFHFAPCIFLATIFQAICFIC